MEELENGATSTENEVKAEKTFTRDELNKIIATEKAKAIEETKKKIEQEMEEQRNEAEKLANMKEKEKFEYELSKKDKEIELLRKKENARLLQEEALKIATTKDTAFNPSLLSLINFENETAESLNEKTKLIKSVWDKSIEQAINEFSKEQPPIQVNGNTATSGKELRNIF